MASNTECSFCAVIADGGQETHDELVTVIADTSPVTEGHLLIVPVRHAVDFFDMTEPEVRQAYLVLRKLRDRLQADDPEIVGFNVGTNCGWAAGQTIFHAHIHLIPRRAGDTTSPRGGVRGVIPGRRSY
jgi:diadenosine tetraphosphate (Ap4A) HIT family hydrolase